MNKKNHWSTNLYQLLCLHTLEARRGQKPMPWQNECSLVSHFLYNIKRTMHFSLSLGKIKNCKDVFKQIFWAFLPLTIYSAGEKCFIPSFAWSQMACMRRSFSFLWYFSPWAERSRFSIPSQAIISASYVAGRKKTGEIALLAFSPEQSCRKSHHTPTIRPFSPPHSGSEFANSYSTMENNKSL